MIVNVEVAVIPVWDTSPPNARSTLPAVILVMVRVTGMLMVSEVPPFTDRSRLMDSGGSREHRDHW